MSRSRKQLRDAARAGVRLWRVTLTHTTEPGKPSGIEVHCGGHPVAETILLLKNAAVLLERQLAAGSKAGASVPGPPPRPTLDVQGPIENVRWGEPPVREDGRIDLGDGDVLDPAGCQSREVADAVQSGQQ